MANAPRLRPRSGEMAALATRDGVWSAIVARVNRVTIRRFSGNQFGEVYEAIAKQRLTGTLTLHISQGTAGALEWKEEDGSDSG